MAAQKVLSINDHYFGLCEKDKRMSETSFFFQAKNLSFLRRQNKSFFSTKLLCRTHISVRCTHKILFRNFTQFKTCLKCIFLKTGADAPVCRKCTLLFSPPTLEEKICYDDNMPPLYDDYNDEYGTFSPPTTEDNIHDDYNVSPIYDYYDENKVAMYDDYCDDSYVVKNNSCENNKTFMHVNPEKNALCDSYIIKFAYDVTESY